MWDTYIFKEYFVVCVMEYEMDILEFVFSDQLLVLSVLLLIYWNIFVRVFHNFTGNLLPKSFAS